jgi:hypothetical protein
MGFGDTWDRDLIGNKDAQDYLKARVPNPNYSLTAIAAPCISPRHTADTYSAGSPAKWFHEGVA